MTKEEINELLLNVYNARVDADSGEGSAARMIERDNDGGKKQRGRAEFYRPVVLETLKQLGLYERPKPVGRPLPAPPKKGDGTVFPTVLEFYDGLPETWDEAAKLGTVTKDEFEKIASKCFDSMLEARKEKK